MGLELRKAVKGDLDVVYGMICELEETLFEREKFDESFLKNLENPSVHYFIAEYNGEAAGFISLSVQYHLHHAAKTGEIVEFFIKNDMRSKGLGKLIIGEIERLASGLGCMTLELSSSRKRERAHKFYERENFRATHFKFVKALS